MNSTALQQPTSTAWIRGHRISRMEEKYLGRFALDANARQALGSEQIGVFVGNCGGLEKTVRHLKDLDEASHDVLWIVVVASKKMNALVYKMWHSPDSPRRVAPSTVPVRWSTPNMIVTTPEGLGGVRPRQLLSEHNSGAREIGGVLVIDMLCHIHKTRGDAEHSWGRWRDRPQVIADFRSAAASDGESPPLILFTEKRAKAVETMRIASVYCLNTFWFVDGATISCRRRITPQDATLVSGDDGVTCCRWENRAHHGT